MSNLHHAVLLVDDDGFEQRLQVWRTNFVHQVRWDVSIVQSNLQAVATRLLRNSDRVLLRHGAERCKAAFGNSECRWSAKCGCWLGSGADDIEWCELPID